MKSTLGINWSTLYFLGCYMALRFVGKKSCLMEWMRIILEEGKTRKCLVNKPVSDIIELINPESQVSDYSSPLSLFWFIFPFFFSRKNRIHYTFDGIYIIYKQNSVRNFLRDFFVVVLRKLFLIENRYFIFNQQWTERLQTRTNQIIQRNI